MLLDHGHVRPETRRALNRTCSCSDPRPKAMDTSVASRGIIVMLRDTVREDATFAALCAGAFIIRNAIAIAVLGSIAFFLLFSV
jgi:hypothetical protein